MMFDFNGKKYEKASTHQKEWGEKLINELDLKGDEWILDLGIYPHLSTDKTFSAHFEAEERTRPLSVDSEAMKHG